MRDFETGQRELQQNEFTHTLLKLENSENVPFCKVWILFPDKYLKENKM